MDDGEVDQVDMEFRRHVQSLCAPIWWESARQTVVNSGTMCVVRTRDALFGVTNNHVLEIYEQHKVEKHDIFCQLGNAPFEPTGNLIDRSTHWDLATFGMSGGPCFRIVAAEDRIELGGFIYEGDYSLGIVFARQACLGSAQGQIAPAPFLTG